MERAIAVGAPGLRRVRLGERPRAAQARPPTAPGGAEQGARDAPAADRRRGRCARSCSPTRCRWTAASTTWSGTSSASTGSNGSTTCRCTSSSGCAARRQVVREPIGVVGAITPWNFPFMLNLSKIVPALAAGNTVILKPAPDTPWSATFIGKLAAEYTDIPPGVLNVVTSGDPATVGEMLTADPRVDMISFTGSTAVGKRIMANGAETLKRVFLELGGKSANIILDDADLAAQCGSGAMVCMHGGQGCAITTRMLLPRSRYDEGVELLQRRVRRLEVRRPDRPGEPAGAADQRPPARAGARATSSRARPRARGCVVGGGRADAVRQGLLRASPRCSWTSTRTPRSRRRRSSGRCSSVIPYEDDDDAVRIANNSRYGLSGAVNGKDLDRAYGIARAHPHRDGRGQRRPVVRSGLAVRRLQAERPRSRARHRRASRSTSRPRRSGCPPPE